MIISFKHKGLELFFMKNDSRLLNAKHVNKLSSLMETQRCQTKAPTHPAALLREIVLPELGMTQTELAKYLGISRYAISEIIHERKPINPDMALRLGQFFGNGARLWLNMQQTYDLWHTEKNKRSEYQKIPQCAVAFQSS